jgi:hypothetical protein
MDSRHDDFNMWFDQCLLHVGVSSFGQELHSTPLKWSKDQTWVPKLSSLYQISFVRNIHKLESLTPYTNDLNQSTRVRGRINTHKNSIRSNNTHIHE